MRCLEQPHFSLHFDVFGPLKFGSQYILNLRLKGTPRSVSETPRVEDAPPEEEILGAPIS